VPKKIEVPRHTFSKDRVYDEEWTEWDKYCRFINRGKGRRKELIPKQWVLDRLEKLKVIKGVAQIIKEINENTS